ncbi:MAG TPA: bifunctional 5,10-methylenetetrahydrofolate dehydrogenase/5,10-methenyltetrahydrofolate cyclohydrolase [Verrucomicrobiae bacterium]|nr:bifunctional 5,10-methylenetetrahydrofolate dehydrogenase/5,10-methenyltetrahydrofolate cyclohydrolase [Verrucomicrobiae bacterium]
MTELSSKPFIDQIHARHRERAATLIDGGIEPHLAVVLVGENPESVKYVATKEKRAKEDGIIFSLYHLEESATVEEIEQSIRFLAMDPEVHGIVLQLPLPPSISSVNAQRLIQLIPAEKDVDGLRGDWQSLTYTSARIADVQKLQSLPLPPMVLAVVSLLDHYHIDPMGKRVVMVGNGKLVGQPLTAFFQALGIDAVAVDEHTEKILDITKSADILITGTGEPDLVTYLWVKEGATVIDCSGDVHTDSVSQIAGALSPATGGIGPLTVAWLLHNVLNAAEVVNA